MYLKRGNQGMDIDYSPFIESTKNCFEMMLGTLPKNGEATDIDKEILSKMDLSAIIGLTGQMNGWIAVRFPKSAAINVVSAMVGLEKDAIDEEVQDAAGEIINIIAGSAKSTFAMAGVDFKIAIPSVVVGDDHTLSPQRNSTYISIPFTSDLGDFYVEMSLVID